MSNERKMPVKARHRSFSSTSLTASHDSLPALPFDPRHYSTQLQHLPYDAPAPSTVGKICRPSGTTTLGFLLFCVWEMKCIVASSVVAQFSGQWQPLIMLLSAIWNNTYQFSHKMLSCRLCCLTSTVMRGHIK